MSLSCDGKNHNMIEIIRCQDYTSEAVVRWCRDCGAVVVDADIDNRTAFGDVMEMRFPTYLRKKALVATSPCPDFGKKGHITKKDQGLFWECECGFYWWKHDLELPD